MASTEHRKTPKEAQKNSLVNHSSQKRSLSLTVPFKTETRCLVAGQPGFELCSRENVSFSLGRGRQVNRVNTILFFLRQVASRELNIPQSYVHLSETSTVTVPNAVFTAGSLGTDTNGKAVQVIFLSFLNRQAQR